MYNTYGLVIRMQVKNKNITIKPNIFYRRLKAECWRANSLSYLRLVTICPLFRWCIVTTINDKFIK